MRLIMKLNQALCDYLKGCVVERDEKKNSWVWRSSKAKCYSLNSS